MKKYINPSSFQLMVKSYGKELPTLIFIHYIRGSYQEDPRKKEGWKSGSWERITHISAKEVIEKKCSICRQIGHNRNIAQISPWMSSCNTCWDCTRCPNCWECTNCWNSNNSTTKEWSGESNNTTTNTRRTISTV